MGSSRRFDGHPTVTQAAFLLVLSASIDEIKANAGSPVIELFSFDHVFPPSVVSWTFPSSVPTQTMFFVQEIRK